jgi:hypothetical protein
MVCSIFITYRISKGKALSSYNKKSKYCFVAGQVKNLSNVRKEKAGKKNGNKDLF